MVKQQKLIKVDKFSKQKIVFSQFAAFFIGPDIKDFHLGSQTHSVTDVKEEVHYPQCDALDSTRKYRTLMLFNISTLFLGNRMLGLLSNRIIRLLSNI